MTEAQSRLLIPSISPAAPGPLYQQIVDGLKREVGDGKLQAGAPLPSFRALAESLMVSLITVKRAYEELEREGIIFRKQGLGTFVTEDGVSRSRQVKRSRAVDLLGQAWREARETGLSADEFTELARKVAQTKGEQET